MNALELTLLYLLAAVLGVVGCRMLRLPPMLGYLAVGVLIGPNALALAQNSAGVQHLAEFGVVWEGGVSNANQAYSHLYTNKLASVNRLYYTLKNWVPRGSFATISTYGTTAENDIIDLT